MGASLLALAKSILYYSLLRLRFISQSSVHHFSLSILLFVKNEEDINLLLKVENQLKNFVFGG